MGKTEQAVTLKLTAAIVVDGAIVRRGTLVEMMEGEAKDLLRRGKAELATERNVPAEDEEKTAATQTKAEKKAAATKAAAE